MMVRLGIPKTLYWVFNLLLIFLLLFTGFRCITLFAFSPGKISLISLLPSFLLGLRFDLRWISIILLPIVLAGFIPALSPFHSSANRKFWTLYLAIVTFVVFFFFAADYGCFSYNKTRLNASALNFVEDPAISATMLWQSYPVLWMIAALILSVLLLRNMFRKLHHRVLLKTQGNSFLYERRWFGWTAVVLGIMSYGSLSMEPLKWKAAFRFNDSFQSYLALNPLQNFFSTLRFRAPHYNESKARQDFNTMALWMDLGNSNFNYKRQVPPAPDAMTGRPNVVLVLCESFSMYKSSMSGNPLNTTPFFQSISDSGLFFTHCFTPHFSTARGLFATITGIPDVQLSMFSTRNPEAMDQHTIINNLENYQKLYFLGGNPSFNNFEGLLHNINGLHMNTGQAFSDKPLNVWGISDKDLFEEANRSFAQQTSPFFAIIQTADNHRPFTIPESDSGFHKQVIPVDSLKKYGFESPEEYNSFRYADYCFQHFIGEARKENYFKNTVFVFIGDHGVSGNAMNIYPEVWTSERLTEEHVPFLIYAPFKLKPDKREEVVSQIDVLPTIAGLIGQSYNNNTLGRDVLHNKGKHFAFIISHDEGKIGMVTDQFYFIKNLNFNKEDIFPLTPSLLSGHQLDSVKSSLSAFTTSFYETAQWMLVHNKK